VPAAPRSPDTDATRLGKAVHRTLEWATSTPWPAAGGVALGELAQAAAREFDSAPDTTERFARRILDSADCAHFFGGAALCWAGNEVPVTVDGEVLRIDRLVQLNDAWWVLDYKLSHAPQELEAYRDQLRRYRMAVQQVQPGAVVRSAFVTGSGALIEVE
jgi:ATP-dependent helicase/nuclease subunit A